jgi:hypothetical protein
MKLVIDGVIGGSLPWNLVFCGVFIAIGIELLGINSLAFAVGLYLPMSLSVPIMAGGIIRWLLEMRKKDPKLEQKRETGVLYSSGLIAGAALTGVLIMVLIGFAESSPGMLSGISKPGVHVVNEKVVLQEVNGEAVKGDYFKVAPDLFPDNSATVASITSSKIELRKLKSAPDADEAAIAALDRKVTALSKALKKAKSRELQIKCLVEGKLTQKTLTLGKWQKLYLTADKTGLKVRSTPEKHDMYAVIAFLLLCASLAYFVMKNPDKEEMGESED